MNNTSKTYLAEIEANKTTTRINRVFRITGINKDNTPNLKRVQARKFSRQINKSQLVIN